MEVDEAYGDRERLVGRVAAFLNGIDDRQWHPRAWVIAHANLATSAAGWRRVIADFEEMSGWKQTSGRASAAAPPPA